METLEILDADDPLSVVTPRCARHGPPVEAGVYGFCAIMRRSVGLTAFVVASMLFTPAATRDALGQQHTSAAVDLGIREALEQYASAFESLDPAAVKKVQPSIDAELLKSAFKQMRSLEVAIDDLRLLSADVSATRVSCRVTQVLIPKAGSKQTIAVVRVIRLRKHDDIWVIDAFER